MPRTPHPRRRLTASEAAIQLGVTHAAITNAIHRGRLKAVRRKHQWMLDPEDLSEYQASKWSTGPRSPEWRAARSLERKRAAYRPSLAGLDLSALPPGRYDLTFTEEHGTYVVQIRMTDDGPELLGWQEVNPQPH